MGTLAIGDVVLIPFPYADFTRYKKRPALIVGRAEFNNIILCQITSKAETSKRAILVRDTNFAVGSLKIDSYIRPDKLFTVEQSIIESKLGSLKSTVTKSVKSAIRQLFT